MPEGGGAVSAVEAAATHASGTGPAPCSPAAIDSEAAEVICQGGVGGSGGVGSMTMWRLQRGDVRRASKEVTTINYR